MLLFLGKILIAHYQRLQLHKQRLPVLIQRLNGILKGLLPLPCLKSRRRSVLLLNETVP